MRNLLALAAAAAIAFVVLGYFLGWYEVQRTPTGTGTEYKVNVHSPKITEDLTKSKEKLRNWLDQAEQGKAPPGSPQIIRPTTDLPSGTPTSFKTAEDGTIVYPSIPLPPPLPTPPSLPTPTPPR